MFVTLLVTQFVFLNVKSEVRPETISKHKTVIISQILKPRSQKEDFLPCL